MIGYGYNLDSSRVTGQSCGAVYSLDATFDPGSSEDQVRLMVQSLLADRFKFRAHRVITQVDGNALTLERGGLKISESQDDDPPSRLPEWARKDSPELRAQSYVSSTLPEAGIAAVFSHRASMAQLAQELSRISSTPFWDRTGLTGNYYFTFRYLWDLSADPRSDAPSLATALQETLGIRLAKQKGPLETLVIDQLDPPGDN